MHAQGLVGCGLTQAPAATALAQVRLLSLRGNELATLPTGGFPNLALLDMSGNPAVGSASALLSDANLSALSGIAQLRVLGIRPPGCRPLMSWHLYAG